MSPARGVVETRDQGARVGDDHQLVTATRVAASQVRLHLAQDVVTYILVKLLPNMDVKFFVRSHLGMISPHCSLHTASIHSLSVIHLPLRGITQ